MARRKRQTKNIIIVVLCVFLVVAVVGGITGFIKLQQDKSPTAKDTPTSTLDTNAFYLVGTMNDWAWTSDQYKFSPVATDISNVTTQYKLTVSLDENTEVKIWKGCDDWSYNNFEYDWEYATRGDNLTITQSGTYNFYLKFYNEGGNSVYVEKIQ